MLITRSESHASTLMAFSFHSNSVLNDHIGRPFFSCVYLVVSSYYKGLSYSGMLQIHRARIAARIALRTLIRPLAPCSKQVKPMSSSALVVGGCLWRLRNPIHLGDVAYRIHLGDSVSFHLPPTHCSGLATPRWNFDSLSSLVSPTGSDDLARLLRHRNLLSSANILQHPEWQVQQMLCQHLSLFWRPPRDLGYLH